MAYGDTVTQPAHPTRTGHTFAGWFTDASLATPYNFNDAVIAEMILVAKWSLNDYTVFFEPQNGAAATAVTVDHGSPVPQPSDPSWAGYTFAGWFVDDAATTPYIFDSQVTGTTTLYAGWITAGEYQVAFVSAGETTTVRVTQGEPVHPPATPNRHGYTFDNWYPAGESTAYDFTEAVQADLTLNAQWTANTYTVSFVTGSGSEWPTVPELSVVYDQLLPLADLPVPTRTGYTFLGWYTDLALSTAYTDSTVSGNITLYAGWAQDSYLVQFDTDGGSALASVNVGHGNPVPFTFAEPTKTGHHVDGCFTDAAKTVLYALDDPVTGPMTLYLRWAQDSYPVTFNTMGGSAVAASSALYGDPVTLPATDPSRSGYQFRGWFTDAAATNPYDSSSATTAALTLYAGWKSTAALTLSADSVAAGQALTVELTGFAAHETVELWLFSRPVQLRQVQLSAAGSAIVQVTIPAGAELGAHRVVAQVHGTQLAFAPLTVKSGRSTTPGGTSAPGSFAALVNTGAETAGPVLAAATGITALFAGAALLLLGRQLRRARRSADAAHECGSRSGALTELTHYTGSGAWA